MLPTASKSCPKSNKSPNLVTLVGSFSYKRDEDTEKGTENEREREREIVR